MNLLRSTRTVKISKLVCNVCFMDFKSSILLVPFDSSTSMTLSRLVIFLDTLTMQISPVPWIVDRSCSLLVFISHCWLRGHPGTEGWDGKAHPDNVNGDKYKLCVEGIRKLWNIFASSVKKCYIWIDFGCMNQDDKDKMGEELEHYDRIIQYCDCLFTPIVDGEHESWDYNRFCSDYFKICSSKSWNLGPYSYLNRGWCRVEMMYAAYLPVLQDSDSLVMRDTLFEAALAYHCSQNRRPHYLFGTKEFEVSSPPFLLPPLQYSYFDEYHPLKGNFSVAEDLKHVNMLIGELMPYIQSKRIHPGYTGDVTNENHRHGHGVMVYENGDEYNGEWREDKRCGHGHMRYSNGDEYDGEWKNDEKHGQGVFKMSIGVYDGNFESSYPCGSGTMTYSDGTLVSGEYKKGLVNGNAVMKYSKDIYIGEWKDDKKHGRGVYHYFSGNAYDGEWKDDKEHGQGTFRFADGAVCTGEWRNGETHAIWRYDEDWIH